MCCRGYFGFNDGWGSKNQIKEVSAGKYDGIAVPVNSYGEDSK